MDWRDFSSSFQNVRSQVKCVDESFVAMPKYQIKCLIVMFPAKYTVKVQKNSVTWKLDVWHGDWKVKNYLREFVGHGCRFIEFYNVIADNGGSINFYDSKLIFNHNNLKGSGVFLVLLNEGHILFEHFQVKFVGLDSGS